jgi:hypothetical protein
VSILLLFNLLKVGVLVIVLVVFIAVESGPFFRGNVELFVKRAQEEETSKKV